MLIAIAISFTVGAVAALVTHDVALGAAGAAIGIVIAAAVYSAEKLAGGGRRS